MISVKGIFLKIEDFLSVLKIVSISTHLHKVIVILWTKYLNSKRLKQFFSKISK